MENKNFIKALVSDFANVSSDTIAFSIYDGKTINNISYPQFADDILHAVGYFKDQNITGQHIALIAPNSYEWFVAFFAVVLTGNVAVAINPALPANVIAQQCAQADVATVCGAKECLVSLQPLLPSANWINYNEMTFTTSLSLADIPSVDQDNTILLLFTSGTTGASKAVEISYNNLRNSIENMDGMFSAGNMDSAISTVPLYHIAGIRGGLAMLWHHKHLGMGRGLKFLLWDMPVFNPTYILLVPVMIENIVKLLKQAPTEIHRKKILGTRLKRITIAGAALKNDIAQYLLDNGFILDNVYAMTESAGDGTWCPVDSSHTASIGRICGNTQCRVLDNEILIKGPSVMKGYYKDPEETAKVIVDGWLHTGDMGYCDEDGYYYITGRKKNVIILSNGENVNPEEIETTFSECEAIEECMVYSDGKGICADVFAKDQDCARGFIKAYNETMPLYRQVYKVNYTNEPLPKTGSGKIKRKENL